MQKNIRIVYNTRELTNLGVSANDDAVKSVKRDCQKKELNLIRVFGALFLSGCLTWLPAIINAILFVSHANAPSGVIAAGHVLFVSQVLLHPLVETGLITEVRNVAAYE